MAGPSHPQRRASLADQEAYWVQTLHGTLPVLEIALDRPRPPVQSFIRSSETAELDARVCTALRQFCSSAHLSVFVVLVTALKILLYRYTGQEDVIVGSLACDSQRQGQSANSWERFTNPVALRTYVAGDASGAELLQRVVQTVACAAAHRDYPCEQLMAQVGGSAMVGRAGLFQVMLILCDTPSDLSQQPCTAAELAESAEYMAECDIVLLVSAAENRLRLTYDYDTALYDASTITRLSGHFQTVLASLLTRPEQPVSSLPLLTEAERQQLLVTWNATQTAYPREACVHECFERQAKRTPEAIALIYQETQLTYRELDIRANQLAHYLRTLGVGPEILVGLYVERSLEMVVALLAICKAGGAYVPLDPAYPQQRLAFMLQDTQTPVVLTQARLAAQLPVQGATVVYLDTDWHVIAQHSETDPDRCTTVDNLVYVIYTSGSTGKPKGVGVPHRGVVRLVMGADYITWTADDVWLQCTPVAFDVSTFEIWGCLLHGARLVIAPPPPLSLAALGQLVEHHQVTTLWLTAGLFQHMVDGHLASLRHVRQFLAGGDVLPVPQVQRVLHELSTCTLINGYGPTENTTFTCCYAMTAASQVGMSVSIGRPIANTQVYVLDDNLQPVPVGVPGALYTSGDGLARGYLHRPDLTAEQFIPHPYSTEPGARLYKTGDQVRYLPDGNLEFLGRRDQQVKIRGFRVELGEIDTVLGQHPAVQAAVVLAREDCPGDKRLVAYVVPHQTRELMTSQLRSFLQERLPAYMMPSTFIILDRLPLTPNGKLDRHALPILHQDRPTQQMPFMAPQTPMEKVLAGVWSQVLGVAQVGIHDNFFALGGHSLLALQVTARLSAVCKMELPVHLFLTRPTIEELALAIEEVLLEEIERLPEDDVQNP